MISGRIASQMSMTNTTYSPTTQVFRGSLIHLIAVLMNKNPNPDVGNLVLYHPTSHEFHIAYWDI